MLSHVANYRTFCSGASENFVKLLSFPPKRAELLEQRLLLLGSLKKSFAAMLAQANACNRRQKPPVRFPYPSRSILIYGFTS
jgi:hypothetical protein